MVVWAAALPAIKAAAPVVAKFAGSALGSFLGGSNKGSSGGTDIGASMSLMRYQTDLQKEYSQWLNENSYSQMRTGLENAGYNPLLAVGATPQQGQVGMANAVSGNTASFSGLQAAQALKVLADTDISKFGKLGAILKNAPELFGKTKKMFQELDIPLESIKEPIQKVIKSIDSTAKSMSKSVEASNSASGKIFQFYNPSSARNVWTNKPVRTRNFNMSTNSYFDRVKKRFAENYQL